METPTRWEKTTIIYADGEDHFAGPYTVEIEPKFGFVAQALAVQEAPKGATVRKIQFQDETCWANDPGLPTALLQADPSTLTPEDHKDYTFLQGIVKGARYFPDKKGVITVDFDLPHPGKVSILFTGLKPADS